MTQALLKKLGIIGIVLAGCQIVLPAVAAQPPGQTTAPYTVSYSGRLTDSLGNSITTPRNLRFSIWSDNDYDAGDITGLGAINVLAVGYNNWQETHTITPDSNGLFHLDLGDITTLPNFSFPTDVYLQVEVKDTVLPDTSYEVLDPDGNNANLTDRHRINSSAFTINADTVDNADVGTGAGNIPVLDGSSLLPISIMPGGINGETFILDNDNTIVGPGSIKLQFGNTLNKFLEYDNALSWFNFNDDLNVTGNITTTGTINGVTINNTTVGPYNQTLALEPDYPGASLQGDGTNNLGKLENFFADTDGAPGNANINYYHWTTRQAAAQDFDIVVRWTIPSGFVSWQATPIQLTSRTGTAVLADNKVDMTIEDTTGTPITLVGASNLVGTTFTTTNVTFVGAPTFTPGEEITMKIKLTSTNIGSADVGKIRLNYNSR